MPSTLSMTIGAERDHSLYIVGVDFVVLTLPMLPPITQSLDSTAESRTPIRELLQFFIIIIAVMSVMSVTFPDTYGVFP